MLQQSPDLTWVRSIFKPDCSTKLELPLYMIPISAGFPSPAEDYLEGTLDLNQLLIRKPAATFFVRVVGDSMTGAGIHCGDLLVVDRSLEAIDGRVVIAVLNGEMVVKRLKVCREQVWLVAENPHYPPIEVTEAMQFEIWGVVVHVVHSV